TFLVSSTYTLYTLPHSSSSTLFPYTTLFRSFRPDRSSIQSRHRPRNQGRQSGNKGTWQRRDGRSRTRPGHGIFESKLLDRNFQRVNHGFARFYRSVVSEREGTVQGAP